MRIKKKEAVIPFRQTLAYRMILLTASIISFLISLFVLIGAIQTGLGPRFFISVAVTSVLALLIFYNLDRLRTARVPKQTLQRMKRR